LNSQGGRGGERRYGGRESDAERFKEPRWPGKKKEDNVPWKTVVRKRIDKHPGVTQGKKKRRENVGFNAQSGRHIARKAAWKTKSHSVFWGAVHGGGEKRGWERGPYLAQRATRLEGGEKGKTVPHH